MTQGEVEQVFEVGDFRVDATQRVLFSTDGKRVTLSARAFELLLYLARHPGELLDKNRLMDAVWPNAVVEENNLNQCVGALRKALGERPGDHKYLVTEPGRGYRLVAPVKLLEREPAPAPKKTGSVHLPRRMLGAAIGAAVVGAMIIVATVAWWSFRGDPTRAPIDEGGSAVPAAQAAFERARGYAERTTRSESDVRNAILAYEEAVRLDPKFARAWAQLSRRHANLVSISYDRSAQRRAAAQAALRKAEQLAPDSIDTQIARGYFVFRVEGDLREAENIFRSLAARAGSYANVNAGLAQITREAGRWDESLQFYAATLVRDVQNPYSQAIICEDYLTGRELALALKACDRALDLLPGDVGTLALKSSIYQARGDVARAHELLTGLRPAPGDWRTLRIMTQQLALEGAPEAAARLLETYLANTDALGTRLGPVRRRLADAQRWLRKETEARLTYEMAQRDLTRELEHQPENASLVAELALVEARLGHEEAATHLTARCGELASRARRDSLEAECASAHAEIALVFGHLDEAARLLETQLVRRGELPPLTPELLRLDPRWIDLRSHPKFSH